MVANVNTAPQHQLRHHDSGQWLSHFVGHVLIVCPRCGGRAAVVPRPGLPKPESWDELVFTPRRLVCAGCGTTADWDPAAKGSAGVALGGPEDPYFRRPLWLQARCAGEVLWAYNLDQVTELTAYVGAQLRERGKPRSNRSMLSRLPPWMKAAANRAEVLAGLARLRELATRSAPADRSDAVEDWGEVRR